MEIPLAHHNVKRYITIHHADSGLSFTFMTTCTNDGFASGEDKALCLKSLIASKLAWRQWKHLCLLHEQPRADASPYLYTLMTAHSMCSHNLCWISYSYPYVYYDYRVYDSLSLGCCGWMLYYAFKIGIWIMTIYSCSLFSWSLYLVSFSRLVPKFSCLRRSFVISS